jgi:D-alanyl-D-alanine dipeptidase
MINNFQKPGLILFSFISILISPVLYGQDSLPKPALNVIRETKTYKQMVSADSNQAMVSLTKMIPGIVLDLRYATLNNFTGRRMYKKGLSYTFLRRPAAKALLAVQQELNTQGYGLKIYDAYRPYGVTVEFWNLIHDERYVANPAKASGHNRGIVTDLTIIDL